MRVEDYMTPNPITISPDDNLKTALERLIGVGRRLPVVNDDGILVGIITDRDIRLAMNSPLVMRERWQDEYLLQSTTVGVCMSSNPVTVNLKTSLQEAVELILKGHFSGLPVVDHERNVVGIITVTDLMEALVDLLTQDHL
jgi:acetoin utilization protein AcuB